MTWFPVLIAVHVALAVALLAPSLLLPFLLRGATQPATNPAVRALMAMQGSGALVIGAGLALTGIGLLVVLGAQLLAKPWLLVALAIYAANLVVAGVISRPNLRRMLRIGADDHETWRRRARTQRYVAYGMAAATGVIGLLMWAKPELW